MLQVGDPDVHSFEFFVGHLLQHHHVLEFAMERVPFGRGILEGSDETGEELLLLVVVGNEEVVSDEIEFHVFEFE